MLKFITICAFIAASSAHYIPSSYHTVAYHPIHVKSEWKAEEWKPEPAAHTEWQPAHVEWKEPETPATYDFKYEVHDEHTGDLKRHSESSVHGAVKGQYSLIDSDGYKRIVDYTADPHHGFQATVKREPTHYKVPVPAPKIIAHHDEHAAW
ncbi:hypothetical protein PVAND_004667 [Polypedilum vanderplanki]|uniref:Cuticle protein n=1 Tax=Polypedilum vanderplanki TaxID=319348 RepID=A0A9J6BYT5_POLVA|nr:hypothetical protein PVAND_004667 [Polypedilum vanderplanki]